MATIKSYTDIEQSKKLAVILPLDSADMEYLLEQWIDETGSHKEAYCETPVIKVDDNSPLQQITHPCWSLAALIGVLPNYEINYSGDFIQLDVNLEAIGTEGDETLLDLLVNMIIHLHELNLL